VTQERLPLAGKVRSGDPAATALVAAAGGTVFQRCPSSTPDPADPAVQAWCAARPVPDGFTVAAASTVPEAALVDAWIATYLWVHESWYPADPQVLTRMGSDLVARLDRSLTRLATRDGRPCAAAWVLPATAGRATVAFAETIRPDEPDGAAIVAAVLAGCLRDLAAVGVDKVLIDGHDSDPHLAPVVATLPAAASEPLLLVELS
jgi:hypothetical protein